MKVVFLLLVSFSLLSCEGSKNDSASKEAVAHKPIDAKISIGIDSSISATDFKVYYRSDDLVLTQLVNKPGDNIINTQREILELSFRDRRGDITVYLLEPGDSIRFAKAQGILTHELLNRRTSGRWDLSYDSLFKSRVLANELTAVSKIINPLSYIDLKSVADLKFVDREGVKSPHDMRFDFMKEFVDSVHATGLTELKSELLKEKEFLDSLYDLRQLSKSYYDIFSKRNKVKRYYLNHINRASNKNDITILPTLEEEFLYYNFYTDIIYKLVNNYFYDVSNISVENNSVGADPRKAYREISESELFSDGFKKVLLQSKLELIISQYRSKEIQKYFSHFQSTYEDWEIVSYLKSKHSLDFANQTSLLVESKNDSVLSVSDIIASSSKEYILLDFWASWCRPCIKALPAVRELEEKFEELQVIYLSKDNDRQKWISAMSRFDIEENNYRIKNEKSSLFMEENNVVLIPRYMILDREGTIISKSSPPPGSDELEEMIKELLNN